MPVDLTVFHQHTVIDSGEYLKVYHIAGQLLLHLNSPGIQPQLELANQPGYSSSGVQSVFREYVESIGFVSEKRGLFRDGYAMGMRPDYYLQIGESGIILEVERGKTTINNMDLLDFWKCHLCDNANYLFLLVPKSLRQNVDEKPRNEYVMVARRIEPFFKPRNYTNVRAVFLFGY